MIVSDMIIGHTHTSCEGLRLLVEASQLWKLRRLEAIRATGATAVLLAPVTASAAGDGQLGRAPISYFAPDPAFAVASDAGAAARELRQVISGLHDAGLEVILQASTRASVSGP